MFRVPRLAEVEQRAVRRLRLYLEGEVRCESQGRFEWDFQDGVLAEELGVRDEYV